MSTYDNEQRHPDWAPDCRCGECSTCTPPLIIGPNIVLAEN